MAMVAALSGAAVCAYAVTLGEKAKESGCVNKPVAITSGFYKCSTTSGAEELATEEQLLAEARVTYANGAPVPLPEEQTSADKYRERIARLRQSVQLHERNIDALKKELGNTK